MIGYCQGMNFIIGRISKYVKNNEHGFWLFVHLVEGILPINFYTQLIGVQVDVKVFNILLNEKLPKVA